MTRLLISLAASACLAFAAPAQKTAGAGGPQKSDQQIEQTIRAKLAKSKIGLDRLKVRVVGGIAYWEGSTNVMQHKGAATRMAKTSGARAVVNNIQISEAARARARAQLEGRNGGGDDGPRRATVKAAGEAARSK